MVISPLPLKFPRQTSTGGERSRKNATPSDFSIAGESTAESVPRRFSIINEDIASLYPDSIWSHAKYSITNEDVWNWKPDQVRVTAHNNLHRSHASKIKTYIKLACLVPYQKAADTRLDLQWI